MKKILLLSSVVAASFLNAQNYYGSEFIGEGGNNYPTNFAKAANNIALSGYIGGSLTGSFPITFKGGAFDGILTSIDPTTGTIQWIKQFASPTNEIVADVTMDIRGNYYLTGYMMGSGNNSMDADPGPEVYPLPVQSILANRDVFVIKLDSNGDFVWAKAMCSPAGMPNDDAATIKVDSLGNVLIAGNYTYLDFDPGAGTQIYTATGNSDGFIVKLDHEGNFVWVKTLSGTSNKKIMDMEVDENDNIYVTGRFQGNIDLNPDTDAAATDIRTTAGGFDTFVAKYTSTGDYVWGLSYGSTGADTPEKIMLNGNNVYVGGAFSGTVDLDPTAGTNSVTALAGSDAYISSFTKDGAYNSSFVIPGSTTNLDTIQDIYFDNSGNLYASGIYQNITVGGTNYVSAATNADNYYLKLDPSMNFSSIYLITGNLAQGVPLITGYDTNKFIASGTSKGPASYDYSNPGTLTDPSAALYYTYLTKFDFETTTMAVNESGSKNKVSIYPNPVKNDVFVKSSTKINAVHIFNMEGRNVYTMQKSNISNLNLSVLPKGVYIMQTVDENGKVSQTKLIKE